MLFKIIKTYLKNRKGHKVIVINPKHKDIYVLYADDVHVEIKTKHIPTGQLIEEINYVGGTKVVIYS